MEDVLTYVGLKALIEKEGKFLILTHAKGRYDLPGGKIQSMENLNEELAREVLEETGLEIQIGKPFSIWKHPYAQINVLLAGFKCTFKSGEVKLSDEHRAYSWMTKEEILNLPPEWSSYLSQAL